MQIHVPYAEAQKIILAALNINPAHSNGASVVIGKRAKKDANKPFTLTPVPPLNLIPKFISENFSLKLSYENIIRFIKNNRNIEAIKELRSLGPYGLHPAKVAIENWERFNAVAVSLNRWPSVSGFNEVIS